MLLSFIGFEFLFGHQDWCCREQHICIQVKIYSDILMNIYSRGEGLPSDTIQKEAARRASRVGERYKTPPKKILISISETWMKKTWTPFGKMFIFVQADLNFKNFSKILKVYESWLIYILFMFFSSTLNFFFQNNILCCGYPIA